ncbi:MAG TPA: ribosomal RNA adenine dimethylase [Sphingobacteriaceae bacterium]|nr:ribosomal RNA adenine dimethylase [Sphingobacteriaceae bacterium]
MKRSSLTLEAVKNIKQVGSIFASSSFLAKKITKEIDFSKQIHVLELGAGTGAITKEILNRMSANSVLYSYENNENFIGSLKDLNDKRLIIKGECVSTLDSLEDNYFDIVISSLPLANLTNEFKNKIYKDIRSKLKESGTYLQYQYSLMDYKDIEKLFSNCKLDFCLFNLPPAFIYKVKMLNEPLTLQV